MIGWSFTRRSVESYLEVVLNRFGNLAWLGFFFGGGSGRSSESYLNRVENNVRLVFCRTISRMIPKWCPKQSRICPTTLTELFCGAEWGVDFVNVCCFSFGAAILFTWSAGERWRYFLGLTLQNSRPVSRIPRARFRHLQKHFYYVLSHLRWHFMVYLAFTAQ